MPNDNNEGGADPQSQQQQQPTNQNANPQLAVDIQKQAEELGRLKKIENDFLAYKDQVDPILETLASDETLLKQATTLHNKRLGRVPQDKKEDEDKKEDNKDEHNEQLDDTRGAMVDQISKEFQAKYGIDKLSDEDQKAVLKAVGVKLRQMVDPKNNKTLEQIFATVSLRKLPEYLEDAYYLANKGSIEKSAYERGKSDVVSQYEGGTAMIGSMPSSSITGSDDDALTIIEKQIARNLGVSEEDYLKNKKLKNKAS